MQLFGIGPLEFFLILVIAIIVLGPKGMVSAAQEAGKFIRKITRSPLWREIVDTSNEIREIPGKIVREAGIEKDIEELRTSTRGTIHEIKRSVPPKIAPAAPPSQAPANLADSSRDEKEDNA